MDRANIIILGLPHPRKAAGAQIAQSRRGEAVTINTDAELFWVLQLE